MTLQAARELKTFCAGFTRENFSAFLLQFFMDPDMAVQVANVTALIRTLFTLVGFDLFMNNFNVLSQTSRADKHFKAYFTLKNFSYFALKSFMGQHMAVQIANVTALIRTLITLVGFDLFMNNFNVLSQTSTADKLFKAYFTLETFSYFALKSFMGQHMAVQIANVTALKRTLFTLVEFDLFMNNFNVLSQTSRADKLFKAYLTLLRLGFAISKLPVPF